MSAPTLAEMVREVKRELALRRRVYPRWVSDRLMSRATADRQIEVLEAVARLLASMAEETAPLRVPAIDGEQEWER